jgi:hypothetical protein
MLWQQLYKKLFCFFNFYFGDSDQFSPGFILHNLLSNLGGCQTRNNPHLGQTEKEIVEMFLSSFPSFFLSFFLSLNASFLFLAEN